MLLKLYEPWVDGNSRIQYFGRKAIYVSFFAGSSFSSSSSVSGSSWYDLNWPFRNFDVFFLHRNINILVVEDSVKAQSTQFIITRHAVSPQKHFLGLFQTSNFTCAEPSTNLGRPKYTFSSAVDSNVELNMKDVLFPMAVIAGQNGGKTSRKTNCGNESFLSLQGQQRRVEQVEEDDFRYS